MTQDKTPGFEETERFLDRRLQDVAFVGRSMAEFRNLAAFGIKSAQGVLASVCQITVLFSSSLFLT